MKEKVKIWSRRRLLGAFLAFLGLSAMATAQNGTVNANCDATEVITIVRTVDQMDSTYGTVVDLNFGPNLVGYKVYIVAETNGTLNSLTKCPTIGNRVQFYGATPAGYNPNPAAGNPIANPPSYTGATGNNIVPGAENSEVATLDATGKLRINVGDNNTSAVASGSYTFGIFLQEPTASANDCFSDVKTVQIEVVANVYATLALNGDKAYEYICSGTQTSTNIGFTLCGVPSTAQTNGYKLHYALRLDFEETTEGDATTTGDAVVGMVYPGGTISQSNTVIAHEINPTNELTFNIGSQTLTNQTADLARTVAYTFEEGINNFYVEYAVDQDGDGNNETVRLPVLFITNSNNCTGSSADYTAEQTSHTFTVHVAPNFNVQALAYAEARTGEYIPGTLTENTSTALAPTFCQGTLAYMFGETSALATGTGAGTTNYAWTVATTDPVLGLSATDIQNPVSNELVIASTGDPLAPAYTLTLTGTWNDGTNYGAGCSASDDLPIIVTPAPILLLATDQAEVGGVPTWNATNKITAPAVCPGNPVLMATNETVDFAENTEDSRTAYMNAGNYIRANGNNLKYTITLDPADATAAAYTYWRDNAVTSGTLPLTQTNADGTALTPVQYGHFLNNDGNAQANIIYTVENNDPNGCKLVKKDGSSLNLAAEKDGKVQIIFPVQPRPQFNLGAN